MDLEDLKNFALVASVVLTTIDVKLECQELPDTKEDLTVAPGVPPGTLSDCTGQERHLMISN